MPWKNGNPPLYHVWRDMLGRCYNQKAKQYKDYGGRGIIVRPQWKLDYKQWYADMGPTYQAGLTLDRIDNNGNYEPSNCKWSTHKEQQRNQRVTRHVTIEGKTYIAADLADISGLKTDSIIERAKAGLTYTEVIAPERRFNLSGFSLGAQASSLSRKSRTHCKNGHEYSPENTKLRIEGNYTWRTCLTCERAKIARRHK